MTDAELLERFTDISQKNLFPVRRRTIMSEADVILQNIDKFLEVDKLKAENARLTDAVKILEAGLEHYADESFWDDPHPDLGYADATEALKLAKAARDNDK